MPPVHQLAEEHAGGVVELLGVVHHQDEPSLPPPTVDGPAAARSRSAPEIGGDPEIGEERRQGGQGQAGAGRGGPHRGSGHAPVGRQLEGPVGQPGLPEAGPAHQHHPTARRVVDGPGQGTELGIAARRGARPSQTSSPLHVPIVPDPGRRGQGPVTVE